MRDADAGTNWDQGQASLDFLIEAVVPNLAAYESLLLDQILAVEAVSDARSTFAIRTVLSRGPLPLTALA